MPGARGCSPVAGFITPFLARKGDGGMVERAVEHGRDGTAAEVPEAAEKLGEE